MYSSLGNWAGTRSSALPTHQVSPVPVNNTGNPHMDHTGVEQNPPAVIPEPVDQCKKEASTAHAKLEGFYHTQSKKPTYEERKKLSRATGMTTEAIGSWYADTSPSTVRRLLILGPGSLIREKRIRPGRRPSRTLSRNPAFAIMMKRKQFWRPLSSRMRTRVPMSAPSSPRGSGSTLRQYATGMHWVIHSSGGFCLTEYKQQVS